MIQRIQSIFLLLAGLVIASLFILPLVHGVYINRQVMTIMVTGAYRGVDGKSLIVEPFTALTIGTAVVALLPIAIIFMYKNRQRQIAACYGTMVTIIAFSYWTAQTVKTAIGDSYLDMDNYGLGILALSVSMIFVLLAQKSIQRDEKLVRSADRLR